MATKYWLGTAPKTTHAFTGSIDSVDGTPANNTFTVTIGGISVSVAGDTDVATTAANLLTALLAETHLYFAAANIVWTNPSAGNITGTAAVAGVLNVATLTVSGAGSGSVTDFADDTAAQGPNFWDTAANWSDGAVPGAGDTVILRANSVNICWGLSNAGTTLTHVIQEKSYTGKIGLDTTQFATSSDAATKDSAKTEYRQAYLKIDVTLLEIGQQIAPGSSAGSGRVMYDTGTVESTVIIHDTANAPSESGRPSVRLLANKNTTDIFIRSAKGGVGIAMDAPGETSTVRKISVEDTSTTSKVYVGDGVTVPTFEQNGGDNVFNALSSATVTLIEVNGGKLRTEGAYDVTALEVNAGTVISNHVKSGGASIVTVNLNGGELDAQQSQRARTWTTVNIKSGSNAKLKGDSDVLTITTLNETGGKYVLSAA